MNCVILQPSYIPWRGYFHQIQKADIFVFYDDVQYDKHGWRHRNKIKTANGAQWLSIPVCSKGAVASKTVINEIKISNDSKWARKHWQSLSQTYSKTPFFAEYRDELESYYSEPPTSLVDFTIPLTVKIADWLGITNTKFVRSSELNAPGAKTERLLSILKTLNVDHYISGPAAQAYLDETILNDAGITVEFMEYSYPEYPQRHPPFEPQVTVLDLLFMTGADAGGYIWDVSTPLTQPLKSERAA